MKKAIAFYIVAIVLGIVLGELYTIPNLQATVIITTVFITCATALTLAIYDNKEAEQ